MPLTRLIGHLRAVDPPPPYEGATNALIDGYVAWREACAQVDAAYSRCSASEPADRDLAFAAYGAALEREEHAARVYERWVEIVRRSASEQTEDGSRRAAQ
jgi:hypothetical protein